MKRIRHIITSVGHGGAQKVLADLVNAEPERAEHHLASLVEVEPFFKMQPASIQSLALQRGLVSVKAIWRLRRFVAELRPDVVHAWLYHANFASAFIREMCPRLVWSIHNTNLDRTQSKRITRLITRCCSRLSHWIPFGIIYASRWLCSGARGSELRRRCRQSMRSKRAPRRSADRFVSKVQQRSPCA